MTEPDDEAAFDQVASPTVAAARHPALHRLIQVGRIVVIVAVLAAVVYAAIREWGAVRHTISLLSWKSLVGSLAAIILGMFTSVKVWQHLLASTGVAVRYRHAALVNLVGQLGKYLPGSVWAFLLQTQLSRRYQISRARALITLLLAAGLTTVTALTLAVAAAPALAGAWGAAAWLLLLGPLALVTLIPAVLGKIANLALRLLRQPPLPHPPIGSEVLKALLWSMASWGFFGAHLWLLTGSLTKQPLTAFAITTGAFALAMSSGFIAFILPSGVGVREAVLVAGLAPIAAAGPALALALTSRLLFTIADVSSAAVAAVIARAGLRSDQRPEGSSSDQREAYADPAEP